MVFIIIKYLFSIKILDFFKILIRKIISFNFFEPVYKSNQVFSEFPAEVTPFLDKDGREFQNSDGSPDLLESLISDRKSRQRVSLEGIQSECNHHGFGAEEVDPG